MERSEGRIPPLADAAHCRAVLACATKRLICSTGATSGISAMLTSIPCATNTLSGLTSFRELGRGVFHHTEGARISGDHVLAGACASEIGRGIFRVWISR